MHTYTSAHLSESPHAVYRVYDLAGNLLYIGVSVDPDARFRNHKNRAEWTGKHHHHELTWYLNRADAEAAETAAIKAEHPKYNVQHNTGHSILPPPGDPARHQPIRQTVDLDQEHHRFLKEFAVQCGPGVSGAQVLRTLLDELMEGPPRTDQVATRIWAAKK
jgi:predicted GIY-YIG superfamily endonuclease